MALEKLRFMVINKKQKIYLPTLVALVVILLGIVLRLKQYSINRSLWFDEAMLALNIVNRSALELTQPLDFYQGAPIGFLFLQKIIIQTLGAYDYILRLLPLFASIFALFLMYRVTKDYIGSFGIPIALVFFAISVPLIYYASEVKQYSSDVMITLLLLFAASRCLRDCSTQSDFLGLGLIGIFSMWLSHPAVFVMSGIGLSIMLVSFLDKNRQKMSWAGGLLFFWLLSFTFLYLVSLRFLSNNSVLLDYWQTSFMPIPPWYNINWFYNTFAKMFATPVGLTNIPISAFLFFLGCLSLVIRNWRFAIILIFPFFTTLAASSLKKYPFSDRLLLFIVPIVFLLIVEGLERIRLVLSKHSRLLSTIVWSLMTISLLYGPTDLVIQNFSNPFRYPTLRQHIKPVIAFLHQYKLSTDAIYVYYGAGPAFQYYAPFYGFENSEYIVGRSSRQEPEQYLQDIDAIINDQGRVWFIFSHNCASCKVNEEIFFLQYLDKLGSKISEFRSFDTSVYLYKFNPRYNN